MINLQLTDEHAERLKGVVNKAKAVILEQSKKVETLISSIKEVDKNISEVVSEDINYLANLCEITQKKITFDINKGQELEFLNAILKGIDNGK